MCDFQQCGILTSVDSHKPVQHPIKIRNTKLYSFSSLTLIEGKAVIRLHICAGLSEALLVARTTLLKNSCRGPNTLQST